jgi:hypothetical protein
MKGCHRSFLLTSSADRVEAHDVIKLADLFKIVTDVVNSKESIKIPINRKTTGEIV